MPESPRELAVPPNVPIDAFEVLRVWVSEQGQEVSVRTEVWDDPAAWGILLADLVRHVASAYSQTTSRSEDDARKRVLEGLLC